MQITVVGSGTVVPRLERRQSCVVVVTGGQTLFFDLGSGAVRGMLPKTKLGKAMAKKLKVYAAAEHPHSAQQPEPLPLSARAAAARK